MYNEEEITERCENVFPVCLLLNRSIFFQSSHTQTREVNKHYQPKAVQKDHLQGHKQRALLRVFIAKDEV